MGPSAGRDICLTVRRLEGPASQTIHTVHIPFSQMQQWMQMASKSGITVLEVSASGSASVVTKQKDQPAAKAQPKKNAPKPATAAKSESKSSNPPSVVDVERPPDVGQDLDGFKTKSQIQPLEAELISVHPS